MTNLVFNFFKLKSLKKVSNKKEKTVSQMLNKDGKNIYKDIYGKGDEPNYVLYDCGEKVTGLKKHVISVTELFPGKVNHEYKMTTGHAHPEEEIYMFLKGKGKLVLKGDDFVEEFIYMSEGDCATIPANVWHRVMNTGSEKLEVLCFFEHYEGRG